LKSLTLHFAASLQWANKYGPIYKLKLMGTAYVITDAKVVQTLLRGDLACPKSSFLEQLDEVSTMLT